MKEIIFPAEEEMTLRRLRELKKESSAAPGNWLIVRFHAHHADKVKELPGFVPWWKYGTLSRLEDAELGAIECFRMIQMPEMRG